MDETDVVDVEAVIHQDLTLYDCYVQELPRREHISEPVGYAEIAFHVPIMARRGEERLEELADLATRHYIEKRGHPGRDNVLKVTIKYSDADEDIDTPTTFFTLRFD